MPAAKDGRLPVGREHCDDCDQEAVFYQVQKGKRRGYLYRRCGCGADQSSGTEKQKRWLSSMTRTDQAMIDHPLALESADPVPDPVPDTETHNDPPRSKGWRGLFILAAAAVSALFLT